jgi:rhodanese-related sulfurtransferase
MRHAIALAIVLLAGTAIAQAADKTYPDITHEELLSAVASKTVTLLDANGTDSYNSGHIPTAINFAEVQKDLAAKLPGDKSALIVAYCANEQCAAYRSAAKAASDLGYTNIKHYAKGIMGWKASGAKVEVGK